MKKELKGIVDKFRSIKELGLLDSAQFVNASIRIQKLSKLLLTVFNQQFEEEFKNKFFYKGFKDLQETFNNDAKSELYELTKTMVIIHQGQKRFSSNLLVPSELLDFVGSYEDNLTEDQKILAELFFSNETVFTFLNYSICFLKCKNNS
jgi:hypothetical protein